MPYEYIIQQNFPIQWNEGQAVAHRLLSMTRDMSGRGYLPVHGDPVLSQVNDRDLLCYFIFTMSSWWEIPLIDRINADRPENNFAIIMDINPAPETMYRLSNEAPGTPEIRYKSGLKEVFPSLRSDVADAMFKFLRNGFGHNLFGREPGKILFDNGFDCPPILDNSNVLLVPPIRLALSMVTAFVAKIVMRLLNRSQDRLTRFKKYMTGEMSPGPNGLRSA